MGDLSPHFSRREFECHGKGRRGHKTHPTIVAQDLVEALEKLRAMHGGKPLRIVSGYRCAWWNAKVGGATQSRHMHGDAADIPAGYATTKEAAAAGFDGIGSQGEWAIHVDTRGYVARWRY
jgi:uncharacterized protein YcbK (DUF882 family)